MRLLMEHSGAAQPSSGPASSWRPPCRCRLASAAAAHATLALLAGLLLLLLGSGSAAGVAADGVAAALPPDHDCPPYVGSILDLPDISVCRRLLRLLEQQQPCLPPPPPQQQQQQQEEAAGAAAAASAAAAAGEAVPGLALPVPTADCCRHAASFVSELCHCWGSQFGAAALAAVHGAAAACSSPDQQQEPQQEGSSENGGSDLAEGTRDGGGGGSSSTSEQVVTPAAAAAGRQQQEQQREGAVAAAAAGASAGSSSSGSSTQPKLSTRASQLSRLRGHLFGGGGGGTSSSSSRRQPILLPTATGTATAAGGAAAAPAIRLYVGVLCKGDQREAREAIRATWGGHPAAYLTRFFLARPANDTLFAEVRQEAADRRDMVVLGHVTEHYFNITYQTLEVFRFAAADPSVTHVLKVDADSYVHMDRLMNRLAQLPRERLFFGNIEDPGGHPHRDPNSQWYVSPEEWPEERYPPWAHGAGYVLTADLAAEIASGTAYAASGGGHLFKLEDVALGGWLEWAAARRNFTVQRVADRRFNFAGCRFGDLVSHYIRPQQHRCMWAQAGRCRRC